MIQPKIEKVYKNIKEEFVLDFDPTAIEQHDGYFFTPQEFEQFKREFGKGLLNEVSKNCSCWIYNEANGESETYPIDLEEILPALDDYLLNNKI